MPRPLTQAPGPGRRGYKRPTRVLWPSGHWDRGQFLHAWDGGLQQVSVSKATEPAGMAGGACPFLQSASPSGPLALPSPLPGPFPEVLFRVGSKRAMDQGAVTRQQTCQHPGLGWPASSSARNKCLLFINHPTWGVL